MDKQEFERLASTDAERHQAQDERLASGVATAAMVVGIFGLVGFLVIPALSGFVSVLAVILAYRGITDTRNRPGRPYALTGVFLGWFGAALWLAQLVTIMSIPA